MNLDNIFKNPCLLRLHILCKLSAEDSHEISSLISIENHFLSCCSIIEARKGFIFHMNPHTICLNTEVYLLCYSQHL